LNEDPNLPFADASFEVVLNCFSVEYLTQPLKVFHDLGRVLRPGGLLLVVFTNRKVHRKAVKVWHDLTERRRSLLVKEMVQVCGSFERVGTYRSVGLPRPPDDEFLALGLPSDPIYAVCADSLGGPADRPARSCPPSTTGIPIDRELLRQREEQVGRTHRCPYCEGALTPWDVPQTPFTEWACEQVYVCLDNRCPYYCRSWSAMDEQGNVGFAYRLMYNPDRDRCMPAPAAGLKAHMETVSNPRG
ncbi:MAG: methyltransferase domain-containing protein, partial [Deltaproteobacteria bacterium]|nr:methyltransferase domain-containing protein [Deltaproteobacteria bacterium]